MPEDTTNSARTKAIIAAIFVTAQVAMFAWFRQRFGLLEGITAGIVVTSFWFPHRLTDTRHGTLLIVLGIVFVVVRLGSVWMTSNLSGIYSSFADYLLLVQAFEFWRSSRKSTANYLPGLGCLTLTSLLLSFDSTLAIQQLLWMCLFFVILLFLMLRPDLPGMLRSQRDIKKASILLCTLSVALACGNLFRYELRQDLPIIQRYFTNLNVATARTRFAQARAHFVESASLDSISKAQRENPDVPVFTVYGPHPPGYMRTMAMSQFDGWRWRNRFQRLSDRSTRQPEDSFPTWFSSSDQERPQERFFTIRGTSRGRHTAFDVHVPPGRGRLVPLPVRTTHVLMPSIKLTFDQHGTILRSGADFRRYVTYVADQVTSLEPAEYLRDLLEIPPPESVRILKLSYEICRNATTTRAKAAAIERYFRDEFHYSLESNPASDLGGQSAIQAFLEEKRDAHCEYFATATVLLLRAQNIPSRMCVGYLVYELNDEEDYYVAANRNAHAWAEAYDRASQSWVVVESTPGTREYIQRFSVPRTDEELLSQNSLAGAGNSGFLRSLVSAVSTFWFYFTTNRFSWLLPAGALLLAMAILRMTAGRNEPRPHPGLTHLKRADRAAARLGCIRSGNETCHQFASRLVATHRNAKALAEWYRDYAARRFRSREHAAYVSPAAAIAQLKKAAV